MKNIEKSFKFNYDVLFCPKGSITMPSRFTLYRREYLSLKYSMIQICEFIIKYMFYNYI